MGELRSKRTAAITDMRQTILVVDDERQNRMILQDLLRHAGRVLMAKDGHQALSLVETTDDLDLILLDILMPDMDGFEVLRRLRRVERVREIPVIVITSLEAPDAEKKALELGAADYVRKPFDPEIVAARVNSHLRFIRQGNALRAQTRELIEKEALIRSIYHKTPVMLHSIDPEGRIVSVSDFWLQALGYSEEEVIGRKSTDFLTLESQRHAAETVLPDFFVTGHCDNVEYQFIRKDGRVLDGLLSAVLERDADGTALRSLAVTLDVTERKKAEAQLREAKIQAEKANAAKSRFLAAASHDLRQPLQAMQLFTASLEVSLRENRAASPDGHLALLENIQHSIDDLSGLLNSLLDISKLESGIVRTDVHPFPVTDLLEGARKAFESAAQEAGLELTVVPCSQVIESDPILLRRILDNLVSNAIRYTEAGRILVGCRRRNGALSIEVVDTGCGIDADDLERIFDEFHQLDNPARQREQGLGLGLAIVKRTADLIGHRITVRSVVDRGSAFCVEVPCVAPIEQEDSTEKAEAAREPAVGPQTVLIVEDDPAVLAATGLLLKTWGYHAVEALAFDDAERIIGEDGFCPDLMILDHSLPGHKTGLDVYEMVSGFFGRYIPTIIISGDTSPAQLERFADSGLAHMTKPVDPEELRRQLEAFN